MEDFLFMDFRLPSLNMDKLEGKKSIKGKAYDFYILTIYYKKYCHKSRFFPLFRPKYPPSPSMLTFSFALNVNVMYLKIKCFNNFKRFYLARRWISINDLEIPILFKFFIGRK